MVTSPSRHGIFASVAFVAALAALCFARVVAFEFAYDDHWTIVRNGSLDGDLLDLLWKSVTGRATAIGIPDATRPAMIASMWVDRKLFGLSPAGYHAHSLLVYALAAGLATLAAYGVSRDRVVAFVAGCFFAVAPIHAEPAAAINYREDLIAGCAVLGALACLLRVGRAGIAMAFGLAALWLQGLFGKESASALALLVGVLWAFQPRARVQLRRKRAALGVLAVAGIGWFAWRAWLRSSGRDDVPLTLHDPSVAERLLRTARYLVRVVFDSLVPVFWSPDHARGGEPSAVWAPLLALLVTVIVLLARQRSTRLAGLGLAIAFIAAMPTAPIVGPINERADRYLFVSVLGGGIFWGWAARRAMIWVDPRARAFAFALPLAGLFWASQGAAAAWQSETTLWVAAVRRSPDSARAWTGYSRTLRLAGRLEDAERAVTRAISLDPNFFGARVTHIHTLLRRGKIDEARRAIEEVQRRGGGRQRGMRRAVRCAALDAPDAARCIDGTGQ